MSCYVVSKGGTFGVVHRHYVNEEGIPMVIIRWGPLRWLTPVFEADVKYLKSAYEDEAKTEAEEWLKSVQTSSGRPMTESHSTGV